MGTNELEFVTGTKPHQDFWTVQETGDWAMDCATGRRHAAACVEYMRRTDNAPFLGRVVTHIIAKGRSGPIEIGFFTYIGALACESPVSAKCVAEMADLAS